MVWRLRAAVAGIALAMLAAIWLPALAAADPGLERQFTDHVARERAAAGVAGYAEMSDLVAVARRQAQRMATEGRLYHNPHLADEVDGWDAVGENVGRGPGVDEIHQAFMASDTHRREILSTTFTQVGIGVAVAADGELWVAQVFRQPSAPPPPPTPAAATAPSPAPAPDNAARVAAASVRQTRAPTTRNRASSVAAPAAAPAPPPPPAPTTTVAFAPPDLTTLDRAFEIPLITQEVVATVAPGPEVTIEVRVAATLLLAVVTALAMHVTEMAGGSAVLLPQWLTRSRRRLGATAATLP